MRRPRRPGSPGFTAWNETPAINPGAPAKGPAAVLEGSSATTYGLPPTLDAGVVDSAGATAALVTVKWLLSWTSRTTTRSTGPVAVSSGAFTFTWVGLT